MKKRVLILGLAMMMVMMFSSFVFADDDAFALKSSYPKNGQTNTSMENVGVKLVFNHSISAKETKAHNKKCVKIVDNKGKAIPIKVLSSDDASGLMLVVADNTDEDLEIKNNSEYTLVIDKEFMDDEGNTLGKDEKVTFKTLNQRMNMMVNMVFMFVMMGGIMFFTLRSTRNQNKPKKKEEPEVAFNPYREAKKTGKSLETVIAEEEARQAKKAKKQARKGGAETKREPDSELKLSELLPNVYSVSRPRPISEAGGKYVTGRGKKEEPKKKTQSKTRSKKSGGKKKK
jgi:preprotein translocase subunit YajC